MELIPEEVKTEVIGHSDWQIVDVRQPEDFAHYHISGSINIPLEELHSKYTMLDNAKSTLLISGTGEKARSATLCLCQHDRLNTRVLKGGLSAWMKSGAPIEKSRTLPWEVERQVHVVVSLLILLGISLAYTVNPSFIWLSVGTTLGMLMSGLTGSTVLRDFLADAPWNRGGVTRGRGVVDRHASA
jgi:rhodanese-related sulfurtransferase